MFLQNRATWERQGGRLRRQISVRVETREPGHLMDGAHQDRPLADAIRGELITPESVARGRGRRSVLPIVRETCDHGSDQLHVPIGI